MSEIDTSHSPGERIYWRFPEQSHELICLEADDYWAWHYTTSRKETL